MRKNRNAFFAENNNNFQGYNPMIANMPYQNASHSSSFYAENNMPFNAGYDYNEIMERLAKVERSLNRIDHRLSKLESNATLSSDDYDKPTNNMYIL